MTTNISIGNIYIEILNIKYMHQKDGWNHNINCDIILEIVNNVLLSKNINL